ncbi:MAG: ABC transporter permease [Desulfotignum sp.]
MHLDARQRILTDPWLIIGAGLLGLLACLALAGPVLVPWDPHDISFVPLDPPSCQHWLGVNDGGMDILAELVYGLRNTVIFGMTAAAAGLVLGSVAGLFAAWTGGWTDQILMRLADIVLAIPAIMVLILVAAFFRPPPWVLALTLAALTWPTTARGIRAQTLTFKSSLHIQAARHMGGSSRYIIFRHLMPELFPMYLINFAAKLRMAVFMEASMAFLGLFDPAQKSLGLMIHYGLKYYYMDIWLSWLTPPILLLSMLIMGTTFVTVSFERVLDPRLKTVY